MNETTAIEKLSITIFINIFIGGSLGLGNLFE